MLFNEDINLNEAEKRVFLRVFLKLILADNKIEAQEAQIIKSVGRAYQLSNEMLAEVKMVAREEISDDELAAITTRAKKLELIKAACLISSTDTQISDEEADFIVNITDRLGIDYKKLIEINNLAQDIILLKQRNMRLMELEENA